MKGAFKKSLRKPSSVVSLFLIILTVVVSIVSNYGLSGEYEILEDRLNIFCIDVGQGDCTYIVFPDGKNMLIDAGEKDSEVYYLLENYKIEKIDYLVITHPHSDHAGGMEDIIEKFWVEKIIMPDASSPATFFDNLLDTIDKRNIPVVQAKEGVVIHKEEDLTAEIISPDEDGYNDLNNMSAVIKITYGENEFLFMGDAEIEAEENISADVNADFIRIGHHGSNTSSSESFLIRVKPQYAVISVGEFNSYGHPHDEVIKRYEDLGTEIYRTDQMGTISVVSDGKNITIKPQK